MSWEAGNTRDQSEAPEIQSVPPTLNFDHELLGSIIGPDLPGNGGFEASPDLYAVVVGRVYVKTMRFSERVESAGDVKAD